MKAIFKILVILVLQSTCIQAQTIVDLSNRNGEHNSNTYYKDTTNRLNPFDGTWVYDDGVTYIKLILTKKIQAPVGDYFEDILIGEFQYKIDGNEVINTLNNLNTNIIDPYNHKIHGNYFWNNRTPFDDFTTDNFRLKTSIIENGCISHVDIRILIHNGQQAIQIFKRKPLDLYQNCQPVIPGGFYYLIKQ